MSVIFTLCGKREQAHLDESVLHRSAEVGASLQALLYRRETGYLLRFPEITDFEIASDGHRVVAWKVPGIAAATVERLYWSRVHPLALFRQGRLVLHASAVDLNGKGLIFVGESGRGKSTLAASFAAAGFRFLTDDCLPLEEADRRWQILPDYPGIRLRHDSHRALVNDEAFGPSHNVNIKSLFSSPQITHCDEPLPLHRVYALGTGAAPTITIERLKPIDALTKLVKGAFILDIVEREALAHHFDRLSRLASLPIYYRLNYPRRYDVLPRLHEAIIRHAHEGEVKQDEY